MKQAIICFVFSSILLLVGCTVTQPLPTSQPVAALPTASVTTQPAHSTATPVPSATNLPDPTTLTATPMPTIPPTDTPTPLPTPQPTADPTHAPDIIDPSLPPLPGQMLMIWDPNPPEKVDGEYIDSFHYNFYQIIPGATPAFNLIDTAPSYVSSSPYTMNISPDQRKIALRLIDDTNENGQFDFSGYDVDKYTVHMYDVAHKTITPFVSGNSSIFFVSWLSDSHALLYPQGEKILLARLDNFASETLLEIPDSYIMNMTLSSDDRFLVTFTNNYQIQVYDLVLDKMVASADDTQFRDMQKTVWSPDGSLLAFGQHGFFLFRPLSLFNTETKEFTVSVANPDDIVSIPSWSPDGQRLAFTTNQTTLSLWNKNDQTVTEIVTDTIVSAPIWSPTGNQLSVGIVNDGVGKLLSVDIETDVVQEWHVGDDIQEIKILSWSPDGNWVAFMVDGSHNSGLYIAPKQEDHIYLILDTTIDAVGNFAWLPTP